MSCYIVCVQPIKSIFCIYEQQCRLVLTHAAGWWPYDLPPCWLTSGRWTSAHMSIFPSFHQACTVCPDRCLTRNDTLMLGGTVCGIPQMMLHKFWITPPERRGNSEFKQHHHLPPPEKMSLSQCSENYTSGRNIADDAQNTFLQPRYTIGMMSNTIVCWHSKIQGIWRVFIAPSTE